MAKRKQRHEEHPDERWLITYADVLTLMFVLFMVLFSISVVNTAKFDMLKQTLQDAFNSGLAAGRRQRARDQPRRTGARRDDPARPDRARGPEPPGHLRRPTPRPSRCSRASQLQAAEKAIEQKLDDAGVGGKVSTSVNERGLAIRLETDGVLFTPGSATLRAAGARDHRADRRLA